ncbi:biopolymer transporter ExbD [candidate division WOR-3 bacterium]|nr:biopolymer transporter ExbD [candidate division WOR-3 bacterium]
MKLHEKKIKSAEIPTASMADIAFLLLIFFMVTTVFANEVGLQIMLPEKGEEVKVKSENIQRIYVEEKGELRLNGEPVSQDQLVDEVKKILAENKDAIFSIKTHPRAQYEYMINALDKLRLANAERYSLAPSSEE